MNTNRAMKTAPLNRPAFVDESPINVNGICGRRLLVAYRLKGCERARRGDGCAMCGFSSYADQEVTEEDVIKQHDFVLRRLKRHRYIQCDLLTLGSFYNDREISPRLRKRFLTSLAGVKSIRRVLTESRREYVSAIKLKEAKSCLRKNQTLVYAFGYETGDEHLRNRILRKDVREEDLVGSLEICREAGVDFAAYVLIKPPTLSEKEAIQDATDTAVHVLRKARDAGVKAYIAFEPVFVPENTVLDVQFIEGKYKPPKLWSVVETLIQTARKLHMRNTRGKLFVGLSDEELSDGRMVSNCGICDSRVIKAIQNFNGDQDIAKLEKLHHCCKEDWRKV